MQSNVRSKKYFITEQMNFLDYL